MKSESLKVVDFASLAECLGEGRGLTLEIRTFISSKINELTRPSLFNQFNKLVNDNDDLKQFIIDTFSLPEKAILRYFPKTKKLIILDGERSLNQIIKLDKDDLDELDELDPISNLDEFIDLELARSKESIFLYKKRTVLSSIKSFFNEKTLAATTIFLAGTMSVLSNNLDNFFDNKAKTNLATKLIAASDNKLNYEFIASANSVVNDLDGWDYKSIRAQKDIQDFVEKYFSDDSRLVKSKKLSVNYSVDEIFRQIKSLPNMSDSSNNDEFLIEVAQKIKEVSSITGIDYKIFISIIKTESSFKQDSVSSTGDFSLAQINFKTWEQEFNLLGLNPIDFNKLKSDHGYSIELMGQILKILKGRHRSDDYWYARYHSSTPRLKMNYYKKLNKVISKLENEESEKLKVDIKSLVSKIDQVDGSNSIRSVETFKEELKKLLVHTNIKRSSKQNNYANN